MPTQFTPLQKKLITKINALKKEKEAIILAHNYQRPEIYEVADFIGDSLELSRQAAETKAKIIVFCGVHFMAESAKLLSPEKKVLLPNIHAGCFLADMINAERLRKEKKKHPKATVVCYVNTTAEVKAECDIACTSANAIKIVESLPQDEIIFVPDQNLGAYVQRFTKKKLILWPGFCYVHTRITSEKVKLAKEKHPNAPFIAHPECPPAIIDLADFVTSTSGMIKVARENPAQEFLIGTEAGMGERLRQEVPKKHFYLLGPECINMKQITLENTYECLLEEKNEITIDTEIARRAKKSLDEMLKVS